MSQRDLTRLPDTSIGSASIRAEGPRTLLPGPLGLTAVPRSLTVPPPAGPLARIWSARRWWLVPLFTLLGCSGAVPLLLPPAKQAPVLHTPDALVRYEIAASTTDIGGRSNRELVDIVRTEVQLIAEPQTCAIAAANPQLQRLMPWLARADREDPATQRRIARALAPNVTATLVPNTELVKIQATSEDESLAAAECNAFADAFIERCRAHFPGPTDANVEPILLQIKQSEAAKASLVSRRQKILADSDTSLIDVEEKALAAQLEHNASLKITATDAHSGAVAHVERLKQPPADGIVEKFTRMKPDRLEEAKLRDALYQDAKKEQIAAARGYAAERAAGKTELHRDVIIAAERVKHADAVIEKRTAELSAETDAALAKEQDAVIAAANSQAAQDVKVADQKIVDIDKERTTLEEKAKSLAAERARRQAIRSEMEVVDADLAREARHREELDKDYYAAVAANKAPPAYTLSVVRHAQVTPASTPAPRRLTPERRRLFAGSAAASGVIIGLLLTFTTGANRAAHRRQSQQVASLLGGALLGAIPAAAVSRHSGDAKRKTAQRGVAEAFRHLRNHLLIHIGAIPPGEPYTLGVTSPRRGDGRSCIAVGLAVSMAKAGQRVLLVDADLRNPALHRLFSVTTRSGLCELIEGKADPADTIVRTDTANLCLLPAGKSSVDPGELLAWPQIGAYVAAIGRRFDHVILDLAPLLETADATTLLEQVKGTLLVTVPAADLSEVARAMERLRGDRSKLLGAVMNRCDE